MANTQTELVQMHLVYNLNHFLVKYSYLGKSPLE